MRMRLLAVIAVMAAFAVTPAAAQNYKGRGKDATAKFAMAEGVAIFEVQHRGAGDFVVKLLDDGGNEIGEVARGLGEFGGAKAIRIPKTGYYLFDVDATGEWNIRLRELTPDGGSAGNPEEAERGAAAGKVDAGRPGTSGWIGKGILGGILLGPIGTAFVVNRAGVSAEDAAALASSSQPMNELAYTMAYREAYARQLRTRQQRSALIGGAIGTGILVFAIFQAIDLGTSSAEVETGDPNGNPAILVPLLRWSH